MSNTPPESLTLDRIDTPLGEVLLVTDADGAVRALDFHDFEPRMTRLLARHCGAFELVPGAAPARWRDAVKAYFGGDRTALEHVIIRTGGTEFQRAVWAALRAIPPGQTRTYGQIAEAVGSPRAVRATGMANGQNPIALIVPCHRVIGANGTLTGYAGGVERKRWLLAHETDAAQIP
ncbi:MAG: methylated-DNA--[protein]-cysteine S-methyltransferase [Cypionkella sp.]